MDPVTNVPVADHKFDAIHPVEVQAVARDLRKNPYYYLTADKAKAMVFSYSPQSSKIVNDLIDTFFAEEGRAAVAVAEELADHLDEGVKRMLINGDWLTMKERARRTGS